MASATERPPLWRDVRALRIGSQVAVVAAVVAFLAYIYDNVRANQRRQGISSTFDFLDQPAGFRIADTDFAPSGTVLDAMYAGFSNTVAVALTGIVLTLLLGTLLGVARLSDNWVVAKAAGAYVETFRNLPPLVVIIFVNTFALASLPAIQEAHQVSLPLVGDVLVLSVGQNGVVSPRDTGGAGTYILLLVVTLAAGIGLRSWLGRREDRLGRPQHKTLTATAFVAGVSVWGYMALSGPIGLSRPEVETFGIIGGVTRGLPFFSVLVGLVLYTASHVAEIVRGSILAVPRGQNEAARAVGLSSAQRLRYVVLPQAFRVATPPIINQFLNLAKNTSLGLAVGYAEVMFVTSTAIGNGHPAIQAIIVVMGFYVVLSLGISAVSNVANRRLQLVER